MFTVKILKSYFLDGMVYMYVALWMLNSQYGIIKILIDYSGTHGNDNDDDNDESHDDG